MVILGAGLALLQGSNPFLDTQTPLQYAPTRDADLLNLRIQLDVDYEQRGFRGTTWNTFQGLREGVRTVRIHAGTSLIIESVRLDGAPAKFERVGREIRVETPPTRLGRQFVIETRYRSGPARQGGLMGAAFHWIQPRTDDRAAIWGVDPKDRQGFWTQGEPETNSEWAPTWDYPNDFATCMTTTTVPAHWNVIGNGTKIGEKVTGGRRTVSWKMTQPHVTYLVSLVAGPFDIRYDRWNNLPLIYSVPKGMSAYIDDSFGDTKDMLAFFSRKLKVPYPWPMYAQNAVYEFPGGMENVSSTTLGAGALTSAREGFRNMSGLNAHELAHQWFGDLVTCSTWGDLWINEGFATYFEAVYFEHARGRVGFLSELTGMAEAYIGESKRYVRPLSTRRYPNPDSVFDSHAYPKAGYVLHMLRRELGDDAFFRGLKFFLERHRHQPVESADLRLAMTHATGVELAPFWDQWIDKPGHPVLEWSHRFDSPVNRSSLYGTVSIDVKQIQNLAPGTPLYRAPLVIGLISARGELQRFRFTLDAREEQRFQIPNVLPPATVILDPDHDLLREIPTQPWTKEELEVLVERAPHPADRRFAFAQLAAPTTGPANAAAVRALQSDRGRFPYIENVEPLGRRALPEVRSLWLGQLDHPNFTRRAGAARALGRLPKDEATERALRAMITPTSPVPSTVAAIQALAQIDRGGNRDVFERARTINDRTFQVKQAAERALR
jgi:aminopeptidase N